ncbi:branched-chain amino acid ABC transporter permease [Nocardioides dongxiaopingii]|uniref:branched-chain amino acid ABC transporter permease n=1 Tax=Nocardioides sp. S-1144 TaxID=2582905 RepID=UPI001161D588|nr:branched-chain amino acid ABC transporter permease [Nocardioides sp. S-1144]QCW50088.2 branched-chain amino acid ABC transporter permease [Nocardioides sp. S-1144]
MRALLARVREQTLVRHLLVAAVAVVVVVAVLTAVSDYRSTQLTQMAYLATAAGGLTVLTGLNGQISLGHGALMAFGAYTTALLLPDQDAGTPLPLVILAATALTVVVGVVVGVAAARLHGPYLAGATLALAIAVPGIALHFDGRLGGDQGLRVSVPEIPRWATDTAYYLTGSDPTRSKYVSFVAWMVLIVVFVLLANLARSRVGRRWAAVRDDEVAAELAGIDLGRARISAFTVSAATAGAAGALLALWNRGVSPGAFSLTLSLTLLAIVVLGGLGSLTGALVGAALLTFLPKVVTDAGSDLGLSDIRAAELSPLVYGLVMVLVILLAPRGLVGSLLGLAHRLRRRSSPGPRPSSAAPSSAAPSSAAPSSATPTRTTDEGAP